jgi:hypothetical protein
MGEERNAHRALAGNPEGKKAVGRSRDIWKYNIKMGLIDMGSDGGFTCLRTGKSCALP